MAFHRKPELCGPGVEAILFPDRSAAFLNDATLDGNLVLFEPGPQCQAKPSSFLLRELRLTVMAVGKFEQSRTKDKQVGFGNETAAFTRKAVSADLTAAQLTDYALPALRTSLTFSFGWLPKLGKRRPDRISDQ